MMGCAGGRAAAGRRAMRALAVLLLAAALAAPAFPFPPAGTAQAATGEGRVVVELAGYSKWRALDPAGISGLDPITRQSYKYSRERYGKEFRYSLAGLTRPSYDLELSCVESHYEGPGMRRFDVSVNGATVLDDLDLFAAVGRNAAWQVTLPGQAPVDGVLEVSFRAGAGEATVSTIRLLADGETMLEVAASESRHWSSYPLRFAPGLRQDVHEAALGKMGSRCLLNPVPQLLGMRQSSFGTLTEDLGELALAFREPGGRAVCLPFTDRYPVFSDILQEDTLTGVAYACEDPSLPFRAEVTFTAPFYPGDEKLSTAPFFYLGIKVTNDGSGPVEGEFLILRPHRDDNSGPRAPRALAGSASGYKYSAVYSYDDESCTLPGQANQLFEASEALAVDDGTGFAWHYEDISDTSWVWPSPAGYPLPHPHKAYTFRPKGYSGGEWSFALDAGGSAERTLALASYSDAPALAVGGDFSYRFLYTDPAGPAFACVEDVADYALGAERAGIEEKTAFFDSVLSGEYLQGFNDDYRRLAAVAFQGFIINTWWCVNASGERWYSIWEGNCNFHSTVDVECNTAWFYLYFWPELLASELEAWTGYEKSNPQGTYLSHDIGRYVRVHAQTYPHDMPVEENANWLLLMYAYWKQRGDTGLMRDLFGHAAAYARFILACDTDSDGLPDLHTANTIDQGSDSVQTARNQTYLGVKTLAALRAAEEMAGAQPVPDRPLQRACRERIVLINHTLEERTWLGDHFRICDDPDISPEEAEAYSIYAASGLLWVLASSLDAGIDQSNLSRLRADLAAALERTRRLYGSIHSSANNENQWVSQDIWRDALGFYLGAEGWPEGQPARDSGYWNLQKYFATKQNGSFWDAVYYFGNYRYNGASEALSLGMQNGGEVGDYLEGAALENGGARGACVSHGMVYRQSLGYYPRGTACLALIAAAGGVRLDRAGGSIFYDGKAGYRRVPVFACADWGSPDPAARIPVLEFDDGGELTGTRNASLLPATPRPYRELPLTDLKVEPGSISPDEGGVNDEAVVTFTPPTGVRPPSAVVMRGSRVIRTVFEDGGAYAWDGRDALGRAADEGSYRIRFDAVCLEDGRFTPASEAVIAVNSVVPGPSRTWYLAEGYTGSNDSAGDFETWILVQNPGPEDAQLTLTLMLEGGETVRRPFTAPASSRLTVSVDEILPEAECSARIDSDREVVVERAVYFKGRRAGHATVGVTAPSRTWYLAEGYTGEGFDEWILIQNPGDDQANINLFLRPESGSQVPVSFTVPPLARHTVHVNEILGDAQVSAQVSASVPVVVERSQYLNEYRAGTGSIGARRLSRQWYFAEGYTGGGFEEWLLVANPGINPAGVTMQFVEPDGTRTTRAYEVGPRRRFTVPVHDLFPGRELSVFIDSDEPVVAERAMYWGGRVEGHATIGTPAPSHGWCFAEGYTAEGFEEWLLVANPGSDPCRVEFTFMFRDGGTSGLSQEVGPRSRFTLNVGDQVGRREVSVRVTASSRVVAERAQYFGSRAGGTCTIGARY